MVKNINSAFGRGLQDTRDMGRRLSYPNPRTEDDGRGSPSRKQSLKQSRKIMRRKRMKHPGGPAGGSPCIRSTGGRHEPDG